MPIGDAEAEMLAHRLALYDLLRVVVMEGQEVF
jgi:hypothetical protein